MKKINSYDDELYKQMSQNIKVKHFLDNNLKNKFFKRMALEFNKLEE